MSVLQQLGILQDNSNIVSVLRIMAHGIELIQRIYTVH